MTGFQLQATHSHLRCHRRTRPVVALGDTAEEPGLLLWVVALLLSIPHGPARQGRHNQTSGSWGRQSTEAGGTKPQTTVFISPHRLRLASGVCGKAGGGGRDPKSTPPGHAAPWHRRVDRMGRTLSHEASLSSLPGQHPGSHILADHSTSGHPPCSL